MTKQCDNYASFRYTWPGKDESHICMEHAGQLAGLANALGLHLQLIPLAYAISQDLPKELPTCKQQVKE